MTTHDIHALRERAKELRCLYRIHEIVSRRNQSPAQTFLEILEAIPEGWQRPETTGGRIEYLGRSYVGPGYSSGGCTIAASIHLHGVEFGRIEVSDAFIVEDEGAPVFLPEETDLLRNIAHRIGEYLEWKHTELLGGVAAPAREHWRWREGYARALAAGLDAERFGVTKIYLGGSTETGDAGPGSDIDLIIVHNGTASQREALHHWVEGWSLCLAALAEQQTGYTFPGGMLNVQWQDEAPDLRHRPDLREMSTA